MFSILNTYSHLPSTRAVAAGIVFGTSRTLCAKIIENRFSLASVAVFPTSSFAMVGIFFRCIIGILGAPLLEEALFRKDLNNPSKLEIVTNSLKFGLIHGLLPGSIETRITHIFLSTIGGFFYCGARVIGGDVWSSAIAHSLYNFSEISSYLLASS